MSQFNEGLQTGRVAAEQLVKIRTELKISNLIRLRELQSTTGFLSPEQTQRIEAKLAHYVENSLNTTK